MTDKKKIREEVEKIAKSINPFIPDEDGKNSDYEAGRFAMATQILQIIDSLEEPVRRTSADIESAMQEVEEKSKAFTEAHKGESSDEILAEMRGEGPTSENLEEAAFDYAEACKYEGGEKLLCVEHFKAGAKWQEKQDQSIIELAEDHAMLAGMEKMKEQMIKNATEVTVRIDAGGYPYTPEIELYDYDNDVPLAKEGDKYKVVLIKE